MIKLEHGKYYKANDGRKVGPMVRWIDDENPYSHVWQVGYSEHDLCTTDYCHGGDIWRSDGVSKYTGEDGHLIAEWSEPTEEEVIKSITDSIAKPDKRMPLPDATPQDPTPYEIAAQYKIIVTVTIGEITVSYDGRDK